MYINRKSGVIEVICGPMFAGKTETLLSRIRKLTYANKKILILKPDIDRRYSENAIVSHNKTEVMSININHSSQVIESWENNQDIDVVVIDEVQFLDKNIVNVIDYLANKKVHVIVTGLDTDFRGEPFLFMSDLLARAEIVTKLSAVCVKCGEPATKTQRIIDGKPAKYNNPIILIAANESYEARCRKCHKVPGKKKVNF